MIEQLGNAGVLFDPAVVQAHVPDPGAWAHQPWAHGAWKSLPKRSRAFPRGMSEHSSIAARMALPGVVAEPEPTPAPYRPGNRPAP